MNIPGWDKLNPTERALVEWQYGLCGDFQKALWEAICRAAEANLEKLRLGFPIEVEGYILYLSSPGYWKEVCEKAGGDVKAGY